MYRMYVTVCSLVKFYMIILLHFIWGFGGLTSKTLLRWCVAL